MQNSPGMNSGVGSCPFLQGIFLEWKIPWAEEPGRLHSMTRGVASGTQEERGAQEAGCQPCHPTQSPERLRRWSAPPAAESSLSIAVHLFGGSVRREKNPRMRRLQRSLAWAQWPLGPCRIHTEDLSEAACDGASTAPKPQSESTSHLDSAWAALWEAPPLLCL